MTQFETLSVVIGAAGVVINLILFIMFALQLRALRRQIAVAEEATRLDHDRRRKQATLDFYTATLEKRAALRDLLPYDRDADAIRDLIRDIKSEDDGRGKEITNYLSLFEGLAAGVNSGVYDLDTIERVAGGRIRAIAHNYKSWIDSRRAMFDNPNLYEELDHLAGQLEARRPGRQQLTRT